LDELLIGHLLLLLLLLEPGVLDGRAGLEGAQK
jgi:hypothetical protein